MTLICITHELDPEFRPCMKKDQHFAACDGNEYRYDTNANDYLSTGRKCGGCVPKDASVGLLCWSCWERLEKALEDWSPSFKATLAGIDRAVQPESGGIRSASYGHIPLAGTTLTIDEVESYRRDAPADPTVWVCTPKGAIHALRFTKAVKSAVNAHELCERQHMVQQVRCPRCNQLSLLWFPPGTRTEDVRVQCQNSECTQLITQPETEVEYQRQNYGVQNPILESGGEPVNTIEPEPFDRNNPEHMALIQERA